MCCILHYTTCAPRPGIGFPSPRAGEANALYNTARGCAAAGFVRILQCACSLPAGIHFTTVRTVGGGVGVRSAAAVAVAAPAAAAAAAVTEILEILVLLGILYLIENFRNTLFLIFEINRHTRNIQIYSATIGIFEICSMRFLNSHVQCKAAACDCN